MKLDTVTSNAAGTCDGVVAITTLACRAQAKASVRMLSCGLLAVLILLTGCARETLFKSNFDQTPIGQPPSHAQAVGTANVEGPADSVIVVTPPVTFLHLDFMPDNRVRIDDDPGTLFGTFPSDQVFIVQVTLKIDASAATAHTILSGAGASGQADYTVISALHPVARQFGAIRLMMGFPSTGRFDATTIVVTRNTQ